MNKKILPLFLFLSLISCNYEIINKPGLKGRIKKVIDYKIRIDKNDIGNSKHDTVSISTTKNTFEYNDIGLQIKTDKFNAQDNLIETEIYKYDFDKNGSWIVKKTYKNDTLNYINTRTIEYK